MSLFDRINALECEDEVKFNLIYIITSAMGEDYSFQDLEDMVYVDHHICDEESLVDPDSALYELVRDIQMDIVKILIR